MTTLSNFYSRDYISKYTSETIKKLLPKLFLLFWDHKKKTHNFVNVDCYYHKYNKNFLMCYGEPVLFSSKELEREFLDYHPDAKGLRQFWHYDQLWPCKIYSYTPDELPIELRNNRWCWKNP